MPALNFCMLSRNVAVVVVSVAQEKGRASERSAFLVPISGAVYNALLHPITFFGVQPPPPGHRLKVADFYDHNGHLRI